MSMNPRETTDKIRHDYSEYISSILTVKDETITRLAREEVSHTTFVKGPYLESTLPFMEGKSLKELAEEGLISGEFEKMGTAVHFEEWKLRIHQETAIRHIVTKKRNMIVSTGTGSGKTECYLYPIFNELMRQKERGELGPGVRALLIFPMNALANDQQKKLRKLLRSYPDITFGRYTGESDYKNADETVEEAEVRFHREYDLAHVNEADESLRFSIKNEYMCRDKMIETPPHILLTNYAMLEYLLLQPHTAPFFDDSTAKNWKFIVIDEAHTYKGANGTEIAYLLRRLKERIRHQKKDDFTCIATSATLGSEDGKAGLARFAQDIFDEPFSVDDVITTVRKIRVSQDGDYDFLPADYINLKNAVEGMNETEKGAYLYEKLSKDYRLFRLYDALKERPKRVEEVASRVFEDISSSRERESALINLIELSAAAKPDENTAALLPARYHLFVRSLEGMFIQYYPEKKVFLDRKEKNEEDSSVFELANCHKCNQEYIIGRTQPIGNGNARLVQTSSHEKPEFYFISDVYHDSKTEYDDDDLVEEMAHEKQLEAFHLCLSCGRITPHSQKAPTDCCQTKDENKIVNVYELKYGGEAKESNCCPCCGETGSGLIKRFLTANQPATFAVAKSLYEAIPARPKFIVNDENESSDDFWGSFDDSSDEVESVNVSEEGRKLLIFSDSRQEAAFFAGFFEKTYMREMWRNVILESIIEAENQTLNIKDLFDVVKVKADKKGLYTMDFERGTLLTDKQKEKLAIQYVMKEFITPQDPNSMENLGLIEFFPKKHMPKGNYGLTGNELWNLIVYFMNTLRERGTTTFPEGISITDDFFSPKNNKSFFRKTLSDKKYGNTYYSFMPVGAAVNKRFSFLNKIVFKTLGLSGEAQKNEARRILEEIYDKIIVPSEKAKYITSIDNRDGSGTVYTLNYACWNVRYLSDEETMYRCKKCGKLHHNSIYNICPAFKCDGELEPISVKEIRSVPYYSDLYKQRKIIPMVSREHTAQLSAKTAAEYQKDFEAGLINVLSCSTTFEMGVDVGELEATFLRNVPPETSNYIQRAGRAGRRTSSAAFSVTFARRNSHDMTYFNEPHKIIAGKINPPVLETDNDKIARRHLNSMVIAWFFKNHSEFFNEDTKRIVSVGLDENMSKVLREELNKKPADLLASFHSVFSDEVCKSLKVDEWKFIDDITGKEGSLTRAIEIRESDIKSLQDLKNVSKESSVKEFITAATASKLIRTLEQENSISFLSSNGVLPKYGFPVDSVELKILTSDEESNKIELSRDLKQAISEFAPPSSIVANGKVWTSHTINTIPSKAWPTYIYYECSKCNRIYPPEGNVTNVFVDLKEVEGKQCASCNREMRPKKFIVPKFGFSTKRDEKPKRVGDTKPQKYYATRTQFWGVDNSTEQKRASAKSRVVDLNDSEIKLDYAPDGKLFVLNQGRGNRGLCVCPKCGFAYDFVNAVSMKKHYTNEGRSCENKLEIVSLGHDFSTDILKITLPAITYKNKYANKNSNLSLLYALLEGASYELEISRDDIDGCVTPDGELILFDNTPGGSGFVKLVFENFEAVLEAANKKVDGFCGCTEETSCYGCLRNYGNQIFHDELARGLAKQALEYLLNRKDQVQLLPLQKKKSVSGIKKLKYEVPSDSLTNVFAEAIDNICEDVEDVSCIDALKRMKSYCSNSSIPDAVVCTYLDLEEDRIWPDMMWPEKKIAVFSAENSEAYEKMSKYDWHSFLLNSEFDENEFNEMMLGE